MAHLVQTMAFKGETPWHGLGNQLEPNQPIPVWVKQAGMDWEIRKTDVTYSVSANSVEHQAYPANQVLYRSDTLEPLSVVSDRYKIVQPKEVLHFYKDLVDMAGFEIETAGVLKEGRKLWALAKTGQETLLKGGDRVKGYLPISKNCSPNFTHHCSLIPIAFCS